MSLKYALLCLLSVVLLLAGCGKEQASEEPEQAVSVKAMVVSPADRELTSTYTGSLEGERQAMLYSKLAESVDSLWVAEGDRVAMDEVVLSLDSSGPTSGYLEAKSNYENTAKNYRKMKVLYDQGAVSESEFDAAETMYEVTQANYNAARQLVQIQSPIAGVVTSIDVSPGDFVNIGERLATVATTNKLRVRFAVNSREVGYFHTGGKVKVTAEAVKGYATGNIVSIASSADPLTRAFEVEALIDNGQGLFQPGMFVSIDYILEDLPQVITVPRRAVVTLDDQPTVFTANGDTATMRRVKLGADLRGDVVISSGLNAGDTVITVGQDYVENGTKLTLTEVREQAL